MNQDGNLYEDVARAVADYTKEAIKTVSASIKGGRRAPFVRELRTDADIRGFLEKLNPQEAQEYWGRLNEQDRERVQRVMNGG